MRLIALAALLPLAACGGVNLDRSAGNATPGTGSGDARTFAVADFSSVSLRGSDDVEIRTGAAFAVRATGPAAELDKLEISRDGDTLKIGRKSNSGWSWGDSSERGVRVFVTMPRLASASVAGSGDLRVDRVDGDFDGSIAGAGNMMVSAIRGGTAKLSIAGSGDLTVAGEVQQLDGSIAGSGDIDARNLRAAGASVSIAGSGNVRAQVNGSASVSIVGSGDADLGPNARCTINKMGSGDVRCG